MATRVHRVARVLVGLIALQALVAAYWQVWRGPQLAQDPRNPRLLLAEEQVHRGAILDRYRAPLAQTRFTDGRPVRVYPAGPLFAHLVGYRNLRLGKTGLEAALDAVLLGVKERTPWDALQDTLARRTRRGHDVVLTVDPEVQRAAYEALGARAGAVVLLDPRDGAVLAMVSAPAFDPNAVERTWEALRKDAGSPLLNRATHGRYPPGSTFKVVTMAAALSRRIATPKTTFFCPGFVAVRGQRITDGEGRAHGRVTLNDALVVSCNVAFVQLGLRTGGQTLREFAAAFGIGTPLSFELPTDPGRLPTLAEVAGDGAAQMAFGQGGLLVTPFQMAVVAATIARGGVLPKPYVVAEVRSPEGPVVERHRPQTGERILAAEVAEILRDTMVEVTSRGTGRAAAVPGVAVAGKTGSATTPGGAPHAWFIGFAPAYAPRVAVAVLVEHGGSGGQVAAPIAREVLVRALQRIP